MKSSTCLLPSISLIYDRFGRIYCTIKLIEFQAFVEINAKHASEWPVIEAQKEPLPTADEAATEEDKRQHLDPNQ